MGLGLQNLAWLGKDGQIHTVKQPENYNGPPLRGAVRPLVGSSAPLQNLAWLGEDGQIHTVKQPENYNGIRLVGSSAPRF